MLRRVGGVGWTGKCPPSLLLRQNFVVSLQHDVTQADFAEIVMTLETHFVWEEKRRSSLDFDLLSFLRGDEENIHCLASLSFGSDTVLPDDQTHEKHKGQERRCPHKDHILKSVKN